MPPQPSALNKLSKSQFRNPAAETGQTEGQPPRAHLKIRETAGVNFACAGLLLIPPPAPKYLLVPDAVSKTLWLFDLHRPSGPGVSVLHGNDEKFLASAVSADGDTIGLGSSEGLTTYDTAQLLAAATAQLERGELELEVENPVPPRGYAANVGAGLAAADMLFSKDAPTLFVAWRRGAGITVHDTEHSELPILRKLPFDGRPDIYSNSHLACGGGLLACAGGGGVLTQPPSSVEEARVRRQVQLWRVNANGETELRTIRTPDLADSVALRSDGGLMAIGLRNGVVWLLSPPEESTGAGTEQHAYVELVPEFEGTTAHTLFFSHDGCRLVVGRNGSEDFTVYEVTSAAIVSRFVRPKSQAYTATFFPAADVLVTGGCTTGTQCVFHRLQPPTPRFELVMTTLAEITSADICTSDGEYGTVVAMAGGSQVEVLSEDGTVLLKKDLGKQLATCNSNCKTAVRIQPGGKHVACTLAGTEWVVLAVADGSASLQRSSPGFSSFAATTWSPDGALLALATKSGAEIFSASDSGSGFVEIKVLEDDQIYTVAFDSTGARVAVGAMGGLVTVWDTSAWTRTHTYTINSQVLAVCFSCKGDRLACLSLDGHCIRIFASGSEDEAQVVCGNVNAGSDLKFSPDDEFLICCPDVSQPFDQHRMRVLDSTTGTDVDWGELLRTMALPVADGTLCGRTLGWAQLTLPHSTDTQWVLYGAVGKRLVAMDISSSLHAIQDSAWTTEQLVFSSEHQHDCIGSIAESAPHCSNIRDVATGETMLHCMARTRQVKALEQWLETCPHVTPVADAQGQTALELAVKMDEITLAKLLWKPLSPSLTSVSASLVMEELQLLCKTHPHLVRTFLRDVEPCIVQTLATFRTELARAAEVCGLPTATLASGTSSDGETTSEPENTNGRIPSIWEDKCPVDSPKFLAASRVVVLPGFLGDAASSPFHDIVKHCDATVFESKLLQLLVQYKWEENVRSQRIRSVALYGLAFILGAVAMVSGAQGASSHADLLQGLLVVIEVISLGVEAYELAREGCATYFKGPWNLIDVISSGLLLLGSACYFVGAMDGVQTAGAVGVALKCFGMVDYLRSFPATGSLVRMILVILEDMVPFMTILSFAMLGCMLFFTINLSSSLDLDTDSLSLFRTLVTVYHMTLGIGTGIDTSNASVTTVAVVTVLMSFVVVVLLNLLIAIMGDSYEKVKESERVEATAEMAAIIVESETWFPRSHQYHRFMHFVEAADSAGTSQEIKWEGVTKRVTETVTARTDRLDDELAQIKIEMNDKFDLLDKKLEQLDNKFEQLDNKFEPLDSKLRMILDRLK